MHHYEHRRNRAGSAHSRTGALAALDVRAVNALLILATLLTFVSYLVLNNGVSTKGFEIRALKAKITALEEERQRLDLAAVAGQSMDAMSGRISSMGFVPVASLDFVGASGGAVAVR